MKNKFPEGTHQLFQDAWECWLCGMNTSDCLHHILGRGTGDSKCEASILNAAPLCNNKCHLPRHGYLRTDEGIIDMLNKTMKFLISQGYKLKQIDLDFIGKYHYYYNKINTL